MKILVISDTHGRMDRVYNLFKKLEDIDMIIHLGDNIKDAIELEERLNIDIRYVLGNNDEFEKNNSDFKYMDVIKTQAGKIFITHGHLEGVDFSFNSLFYKAKEQGCNLVCFGHTHRQFYEKFDDIIFINPGSISKPRDCTEGSYAIIETSEEKENSFDIDIIEYTSDKKIAGGYIKNLINYSDRF